MRSYCQRLTRIMGAAKCSDHRCFSLEFTSRRSIVAPGQPFEVALITSAGDGLLQLLIELIPQFG